MDAPQHDAVATREALQTAAQVIAAAETLLGHRLCLYQLYKRSSVCRQR